MNVGLYQAAAWCALPARFKDDFQIEVFYSELRILIMRLGCFLFRVVRMLYDAFN